MDKEVKEFCETYDAYVRASTRMHRRARRLSYRDFTAEGPALWDHVPYEEVACVELHMPEDRFRALIEHDDWLREQRHYQFQNQQSLADQQQRETLLRRQYPALQKAWQQYQLMLKLCDEGR